MCWNVRGRCGDQHLLERKVFARRSPRSSSPPRVSTIPLRGSSMAAQTVYPIGVGMFTPVVAVPIGNESQAVSDLAAPQLVMLANVALTSESNGCDCLVEEKQMVELKTVCSSYSDSEDESLPRFGGYDGHIEQPAVHYPEAQPAPPCQAVPAVEVQQPEEMEQMREAEEDTTGVPERDPSPTWGKRKRVQRPTEAPKKKKPFHCKPCQYQAECEEEFVHHIRKHSAKKLMVVGGAEDEEPAKEPATGEGGDTPICAKGVIRCDRCGYNTNRYDHYVAHLKHHTKEGESQRIYKCTICTYTTVSQYHWKKHLRNHFPSKLYTCSQCCYFSDRKNNYVQHIRTHTGERPFRCPYCKYSSSQKTHLTRHMRTHSGERPFKCETCSYLAANQHEVTRHARQVHNGPKPLSCPHCQYKTADRSNYKKHVELHINPRQFLCPVCSYAASKKCNLQYHIKSRHPDCSEITMDVSKVKLRVKKPESTSTSNPSSSTTSTSNPSSSNSSTPSSRSSATSDCSSISNSSSTSASSSTYYKDDGNTQYMLTGIKEKKKATKQGNTSSEDQQNLTPINLSMKKPSKPGLVPNADKERKERTPKRGEQATDKGGTGKVEKVQVEDKSTEKQSMRAERSERREKSLGKVQRKDDRPDHSGKRAENGTCKAERKREKERKKAARATRSAEDAEVRAPPKRGRIAGKMTSAEEKEKVEKKKERVQRADKEKAERERLEKERIEKEREEQEKANKERMEKEREEKERVEKEREEREKAEKLRKERMEKEGEEKEQAEKKVERAEKQQLEKERQEKGSAEKERMEKEMAEKKRIEEKTDQAEKERVEKEKMEQTMQTKIKKVKLIKSTPQKVVNVAGGPQGTEQNIASSQELPGKPDKSEALTKGGKRKADGVEPSQLQQQPPEQRSGCRKSKRRKEETDPQATSLRSRRKAPTCFQATKDTLTEKLNLPVKLEMKGKKAKGKRKSSLGEAGPEMSDNSEVKTSPVEDIAENELEKEMPPMVVHPAALEEEHQTAVEENFQTNLSQEASARKAVNKVGPEKVETPNNSQSSTEGAPAEDRRAEAQCREISSAPKDTTEVQKEVPDSGQDDRGEPSSPLDLPRTGHKPSDTEEDEGIHSHDGSDISDNVSEGSDDSGLSGSGKLAGPETPTEAPSTPLASHTCIFCDRTFPMEVEYRRHLNRHLVNVYYLESATKEHE
ncbi:RE1-silencing transcription factor [Scleropages formosus]|uniref:RE1-silencing transcription factor n=1 Tax=Scleropages formosus TaxID=113540 RepID=UPI0010FAB408|nr:RE1-silencing transcription factor [Scleropages formosus]